MGIIFAFTLEDNKSNSTTKLIFDEEGRVISSINAGEYDAVNENLSISDEIESSVNSDTLDNMEADNSPSQENGVDNVNWYEAPDEES